MSEFLKLNLKCLYTKILGRNSMIPLVYVDYLRSYHKILNLKEPDTIGAKTQWIKKYGHLEKYTDLVDKYKVRDYVSKKIGSVYLPKLYGVFDNSNQIELNKLPDKFVLKCNHDSGQIFIFKDKSKITKDEWNNVKNKLNKKLSFNFYHVTGERQYKDIERKIICEEYLEDHSKGLADYKIFCFNGKPEYITVNLNPHYKGETFDNFDVEWNELKEFNCIGDINSTEKIEKPENLDEMLHIAKVLSKEFSYVRVDLRLVDKKIYFGELTFTTSNGTCPFVNQEKEKELAKLINLEDYK